MIEVGNPIAYAHDVIIVKRIGRVFDPQVDAKDKHVLPLNRMPDKPT